MAKIIVYLGEQECNALLQPAQREMRVPRAQAALIIRQELARQGMLSIPHTTLETGDQLELQAGAS